MSPFAVAAAFALLVAAVLAEVDRDAPRSTRTLVSRLLSAAAGLSLLFAFDRPAARTAAVLALAAALVAPRSLVCLIAAAAAVLAALRPAPATASGGEVTLLVAALALALAAAAFQASEAGAASRPSAEGAAVFAGAALSLLLSTLDGGRILRWRYGLGGDGARIELPGASLVLGLALLASLGGTLSIAAHRLASTGPSGRMSLLGRRLLILGAGLAGLGWGVVAGQGLGRRPQALARGAVDLAALLLAVGLLAGSLRRLLAASSPRTDSSSTRASRRSSAALLGWAAAATLVAAAAAGVESWWAEGSYATAGVAEASAVALLGLAAVQPTRLARPRAALFLLGLLAFLARAV